MNKNTLKHTMLLKRLKRVYVILLVLSGLSACSVDSHNVTSLMDLYSQEGQHHRIQSPFNGVMLVAKDDNIILRKAYGFHDRSSKKPLVEESAFLIGSITKQFTSMLVLQQVEKGKLNLTSTIDEYLPNMPAEKGSRITLHDLLAHSSGFPHYEGIRLIGMDFQTFSQMTITPMEYVELIGRMPLINKPGTEFYYSSMNYVLLGAILEEVTGQTYSNLLKTHIVEPLKLKNTGYSADALLNKGVSKGYLFSEMNFFTALFSSEKGVYKHASSRDLTNAYSTGGMYSNVDDLFAWTKAVQNSVLLSTELTEKMFTPNLGGYGYGWFINHETMIRFNPFIQLRSHGGTLDGYASNIGLYDDGTTVIYLSNVTPVGDERLMMNMHLTANNVDIEQFERDIKLPEVNDGYDAFAREGGLQAVRDYFKEISSRAGYEVHLSQWGYQELIQLHLSAGMPDIASALFDEMNLHYSFVQKGWLNRIGYDFLQFGELQKAINCFKLNVANHPYSASARHSLGEAYLSDGQIGLAKTHYAGALQLAKANNASTVKFYQNELSNIQ